MRYFSLTNGAEWQKANGISADWKTPEHIEVKPVYTKEDLEGMEHLGYAAGLPPVPASVRTRYVHSASLDHPSSMPDSPLPKISNAFYRRNLASGQKGLSVAFDLATSPRL